MKKIDVGQTITILANVGVIAGIFFLAFEVSQNTDALYAESRQSTLIAAQAELYEVVRNPALMLVVMQEDPLSQEDQVRLAAWLGAMMRAREFSWLQYQAGIMDQDQWSTEVAIIHWILNAPRTREWWDKTSSYNFGANFRDFVNREIGGQPATGENWLSDANWASR